MLLDKESLVTCRFASWLPIICFSGTFLKLRGHMQHFSSTRSKKMLQRFFFGKCYLWHLLATCCNFRHLQQKNVATFLQQNQISLILRCCNSFAAFLMSCSTISLFAAYFLVAICAVYLCSKYYCDFIIYIYITMIL